MITDLALQRGERLLFKGLQMQARAGEAVALVGANGAGKTSLLRAIAGFIRPAHGEIAFRGRDGAALDADEARRGQCHLVGHQDGLKGARTVVEELEFQLSWTATQGTIGQAGAAARAALSMGMAFALDAMDLDRLEHLEVRKLSAGQRRRVALGRLVGAPRDVWLLDEPMAPLDAAHRDAFGALMRTHLEDGGIIVAAVHDPLPMPARQVEIGA